jgi:hypothetical protein
MLWARRENGRARRFYEKHGMRPDGAERSGPHNVMPIEIHETAGTAQAPAGGLDRCHQPIARKRNRGIRATRPDVRGPRVALVRRGIAGYHLPREDNTDARSRPIRGLPSPPVVEARVDR